MTAVISAIGIVVAAAVATGGYLLNQRQARNERLAQLFAEALRAVGEYRGIPFAIRRRQANDAVSARREFADQLSQMHTSLDYYANLVRLEAPNVDKPYRNLVMVLRREVNPQAQHAWTQDAVVSDEGMNMGLGDQYPTPLTNTALGRCLDAMSTELRKLKFR